MQGVVTAELALVPATDLQQQDKARLIAKQVQQGAQRERHRAACRVAADKVAIYRRYILNARPSALPVQQDRLRRIEHLVHVAVNETKHPLVGAVAVYIAFVVDEEAVVAPHRDGAPVHEFVGINFAACAAVCKVSMHQVGGTEEQARLRAHTTCDDQEKKKAAAHE